MREQKIFLFLCLILSVTPSISMTYRGRIKKRRRWDEEEEAEQDTKVLNVPMGDTSPVYHWIFLFIVLISRRWILKKTQNFHFLALSLSFNPYNLLIRYMIDYSHACSKLYINKHFNQPFFWTESINFLHTYIKTRVQMSCHSKLSFVYFNLTNASHLFGSYEKKWLMRKIINETYVYCKLSKKHPINLKEI
jgi:hypothetical protein